METVDQPNSICHIQSIHMYPLQPIESQNPPPFGLLTGEMVLHLGNSVDGLILMTNYRIYLQNGENQHHIPLGLIETIEIRELFYLQLFCKDARTHRCTFENNENALEWYDRITKASEPPRQIEQLFAFYHCIWAKEKGGNEIAMKIEYQNRYTFDKDMFETEMSRMHFQGDSWRITKANENYKLCPTYPPYLLVPSCINDEMLESVAKFRSSKRIPVAVWRHQRNGAIIARCSQPEVGWLGWRSSEDEELLKAISEACNFDRNLRTNSSSDKDSMLSHSPGSLHSDESLQITGEVSHQEEKLLIMDARSYTTAVANRARGGGCECPEYYPNCEIQFMNLANIHSIRKSFHSLRQLCMASAEQPNWFSLLEGTRWLLHMSGLIKAAVTLTTAIERDGRPVLVHCSDGWDRTPQIVALAELLLDPYYRTIDGFRVLIEREWLAFGHKFADRCGQPGGSDDLNERCPVFLQWLDCVHQLITQFPVSFEFSHNYLIKLALHTYSNLFGTFLCNTLKQRNKVVLGRTFSIWEFLSSPNFKNNLYAPQHNNLSGGRILWPKTNVRDLRFWSEVYLGSMESNFSPEDGPGSACPGPPDLNGQSNMTKTRSYGDLISVENSHTFHGNRRSSDPSVNRDLKLLSHDGSSNTIISNHNCVSSSSILQSYQDTAPDFLPSDMEDNPVDCNQDCIFNMHAHPTPNLTDDQIDGLDFGLEDVQTRSELLEYGPNVLNCAIEIPNRLPTILDNRFNLENSSESISLLVKDHDKMGSTMMSENDSTAAIENDSTAASENDSTRSERGSKTENDLDVRGFLENNNNLPSSISESNDSDLGSSKENNLEKRLCKRGEPVGKILDFERSVETSTETLVSEKLGCGSSKENYLFKKHQNSMTNITSTDNCKACPQSARIVNSTTRISPSLNGWDGAYLHSQSQQYSGRAHHCHLGEDGLIPLRSPIQERLEQILEEQRKKVELLEKELHASRQILIKQACHKCQPGDCEKQEDNNSVVESVNSASEGQASAGESLRSDMSWVAVEDGIVAECQGTLWVPDHAVNRCTGCGTEFWLGRRRHHCRKCGKIFCADCSEHATPIPSEQLYNPVRVCSGCYSTLILAESPPFIDKASELPPDRCRRVGSGPQGGQRIQTQISASTN